MKRKILASVLGVFGVVAIVTLGVTATSQQNELNSLRESTSKGAVENVVSVDSNDVNDTTVAKKTYESKYFNVKFEYPESWVIKDEDVRHWQDNFGYDLLNESIVIIKDGKRIKFALSATGSGVGGCVDEYQMGLTRKIEKLADTKITGLSVVRAYPEYNAAGQMDSQNEKIAISVLEGFDEINVCENAYKIGWIVDVERLAGMGIKYLDEYNNPSTAPMVWGQYEGIIDDLSEESKKEIIEILSSFSLK